MLFTQVMFRKTVKFLFQSCKLIHYFCSGVFPSMDILGNHSNHVGRYQAFSPKIFITLGTRIDLTIVASIKTAAPKPNPIDWKNVILPRANPPKQQP